MYTQQLEIISQLIEQDHLDEAAQHLKDLAQAAKWGDIEISVQNNIGNLNGVTRAYEIDGTTTLDEYTTAVNKIRRALLSLVRSAKEIGAAQTGGPIITATMQQAIAPFNEISNAKIVVLYDEQDQPSADTLSKHLTVLRMTGKIDLYNVHSGIANTPVLLTAQKAIDAAHFVFVLISPNIFNNNALWLTTTLSAVDAGKRIIPIRLEKADLEGTPIAELRGLPAMGKTISDYSNSDQAFSEIVSEIKRLLAKV